MREMQPRLAATAWVVAFLTFTFPAAAVAEDVAKASTESSSSGKDDRAARENRRAMKLDDFSNVNVNDAYRAAARQTRHE